MAQATVTLSALRTRAREESDQVNSEFVSDAEANRYINSAIAELMDLLAAGDDQPWNQKVVFLYVPANRDAVYLPCDFHSLIGAEFMDGEKRVPMEPFTQFEKNRRRTVSWKLASPPRYRLGVKQPDHTAWPVATLAMGTAYLYYGQDYHTAIPIEGGNEASWRDCVAQNAVADDPYVEPQDPMVDDANNAYYGRVLYFDRPDTNARYVRLTYIPVAPELSDDTDVFIAYTGWEEYVVVTAAIKMMSKEESDTTDLRVRKAEARERILSGAHQHDSASPKRATNRMYISEDEDITPYRWWY